MQSSSIDLKVMQRRYVSASTTLLICSLWLVTLKSDTGIIRMAHDALIQEGLQKSCISDLSQKTSIDKGANRVKKVWKTVRTLRKRK